jgi:carbon starvation protein
MSLRKGTLIMLPLVMAGLWLGHVWPALPSALPAVWGSDKYFWTWVLLGYSLVASVLPVWALLQPRDYISAFLLYACLIGGAAGLLLGSAGGAAEIAWPAFAAWSTPQDGFIYPALGAMLVEAVLAVLALATVMTLKDRPTGAPPMVFAAGLERFFEPLGLGEGWIASFTMLAVSTFLLTTLDTCTRLSRLLAQEITGIQARTAGQRVLVTALVLALPAFVAFQQIPGPGGESVPAWKAIWPSFGATNQLMGAMALLMVHGWLRRQGKRAGFVFWPMLFMFATTLLALAQIIWRNLKLDGSRLLGGLSAVLFLLAVVVLADMAGRALKARHPSA